MVTDVKVPVGIVLTGKMAVVAPAATVTLAATAAVALSLDKATTAPPAGAGPFKVTVPVEEDPPDTLAGFRDSDVSTAGSMVRVAECATPRVPVIVAVA